jgi:hypothetical protein
VIVCNKSVVKNEDFEIGILGDYILLSFIWWFFFSGENF